MPGQTTLLGAQGLDWIKAGGAAGGKHAGQ
jgi:hypothetical protein